MSAVQLPSPYVYLVTVEGEWPVTAICCTEEQAPDFVAGAVSRRSSDSGGLKKTRVWRAVLTEVQEMESRPERTVKPELSLKGVKS